MVCVRLGGQVNGVASRLRREVLGGKMQFSFKHTAYFTVNQCFFDVVGCC
jgi:hypothetical protein